jgi:hypothetical protein
VLSLDEYTIETYIKEEENISYIIDKENSTYNSLK